MKTSNVIATTLKERGITPTPSTIRCIVFDGDRAHCFNEEMLDAWWANLPAERKADLFETDLEASAPHQSGTCRYCGCTDARACNPPCCWIDAQHTVCSADACVERYEADNASTYESELRDEAPAVLGLPTSSPAPSAEPELRVVEMQELLDTWSGIARPRRHRCAASSPASGKDYSQPGLRIVEVPNAPL